MRTLTLLTNASEGIYGLDGVTHWTLGAIDRFGILILGIVGLAFVIFCEYYYRKGVDRNALWRRFGLVTGMELGLLICLAVSGYLL